MTDHAEFAVNTPNLIIEPAATKAELQAEASARLCEISRLEARLAMLEGQFYALAAQVNDPASGLSATRHALSRE
ncbi:hypothetical protein VPG91_11425 [Nitrospirillum amazonense]|uniref:hypothetical protein n=1 Tax=Nitrospirillum amazonense TaxID=28077 RepID=UPI002DD4359A|nr:hypothetical protein [Nitrospirillum amazonense]MEC4591599.1 hypothetical protein [Nitrospirillum amazonense]